MNRPLTVSYTHLDVYKRQVNTRGIIMLSLLAVAVLLLGVWPDPLTSVMHVSVDNLLQHITVTKL